MPRVSRITVHLMGGLGNQMFQYALGRRLALANEAELILDAGGYPLARSPDPKKGERAPEIGDFRIKAQIIGRGAESEHRGLLERRARKLGRIVRGVFERSRPYYQRHDIVEPAENVFRFDPAIANRRFRGSLSLRGFWQSEKYFSGIEPILRKELTLCSRLSAPMAELASRLRSTNSVAVHVRHTDNASGVAAELGVLHRAYYESAMHGVGAEVADAAYYLFSDDIEWAEQFLGNDPKITSVSTLDSGSASTDLHLMACCRHHITANSTFSWWGAWLGKSQGQIVYTPSRYYQNIDRPNTDLFPPGWRLIDV